jgi:hypothetical protein
LNKAAGVFCTYTVIGIEAFFEELIVTQLVKKLPLSVESKSSLPSSQEPTTKIFS